jgi:hypothetical protein
MVILGIILALIGWIASISIVLWIGVILIIVGLVLNFVPIGGSRRRYYPTAQRGPVWRAPGRTPLLVGLSAYGTGLVWQCGRGTEGHQSPRQQAAVFGVGVLRLWCDSREPVRASRAVAAGLRGVLWNGHRPMRWSTSGGVTMGDDRLCGLAWSDRFGRPGPGLVAGVSPPRFGVRS